MCRHIIDPSLPLQMNMVAGRTEHRPFHKLFKAHKVNQRVQDETLASKVNSDGCSQVSVVVWAAPRNR